MTSLLFFQFMVNLEKTRGQIQDTWSVELTFSLSVTFYLTKTENRIKKPQLTAPIILPWVKILFLTKMQIFCKKNADINKVKGVLVLKGMVSESACVCVLTGWPASSWKIFTWLFPDFPDKKIFFPWPKTSEKVI